MTFAGPINFLDFQSSFDFDFGSTNPSIFRLSSEITSSAPRKKWNISRKIFSPSMISVNSIYIVTQYISSMLLQQLMTPRKYSLIFILYYPPSRLFLSIEGGLFISPLTTYSVIILNSPLLFPNSMTWLFNLVTLFFNSLPLELQEAVQLGRYTLPDLSTLTNSFSQERELQNIRENYIVAYKTLMDVNRRIRKIMTIFSHSRN